MSSTTIMRTECFSVLLILIVCAHTCLTYPSKPLNERSTELSWEAWLLVDQTNRQGDLGLLRRKITPKSVFIAPTFSPDSLPACAEGYTSDAMGRCVKIIKINEAAHLDFLLQKLNEQFADYDDEAEYSAATPGPLQLNIPLPGFNNDDDKDFDNETDMAIVVAPTSAHEKTSTVKLDAKRRNGDKFNAESVAAFLGVRPEDVETTTIADLTTHPEITTTVFTSSKRAADFKGEDISTLETTTIGETTETTTYSDSDSTTTNNPTTLGDALFFRVRL